MRQTLALPVSVLPGSRTLPADLAEMIAIHHPWSRLVPFASSVAAQGRLTTPEELAEGPIQPDLPTDVLAERGALRFLLAAADFDRDEPAWPASDLKTYLRVMEVCGRLRAEVNEALAQRNLECRVRFYAPVAISRALTYGALSHSAAVAYDRITQAAAGGGWSVGQLGVRLAYREGALELQVLSPPDHRAQLFSQSVPVYASEGGLPYSVQAVAASLVAAGAQAVDCDASTSPILVDLVRQRGRDLEVLLKGLPSPTVASRAKGP